MSLKQVYADFLKSELKALVVSNGSQDTLLGYRAFVYSQETEKRYVYDFALDIQLPEEEMRFLSKVTPELERVQLRATKSGKLMSDAEINSGQVVTEISKGKVSEILKLLEVVFVIQGKYDIKSAREGRFLPIVEGKRVK